VTVPLQTNYDIRAGAPEASPEDQVAADPWGFLTPQQKVTPLRCIVDRGVARDMPQLRAEGQGRVRVPE